MSKLGIGRVASVGDVRLLMEVRSAGNEMIGEGERSMRERRVRSNGAGCRVRTCESVSIFEPMVSGWNESSWHARC